MLGGKLKDGVIEYAGANTPGWISNLRLSYSAGTLSIVGSNGLALTDTNPGWVTVQSTTAGKLISLKVTGTHTFNDDAHASSDLTNVEFGVSASSNWSTDMPYYIGVLNKSDSDIDGVDGSSCFALFRNQIITASPSSANNIFDTTAGPTTDDQTTIMLIGSYTKANYVSLGCTIVGVIRMQYLTASHDWTVQTLSALLDGFGPHVLDNCRFNSSLSSGTPVNYDNFAISSSSGAFNTSTGSYVDVTNLSVTITTKGRPVFVGLICDGTVNAGSIQVDFVNAALNGAAFFRLYRDAVNIGTYNIYIQGDASSAAWSCLLPCSAVQHLDVVTAGTYVYKLQASSGAATDIAAYVNYAKLIAYEI